MPPEPGLVTVVGVDGRPLGEDALAALARASLVVGWPEHLAAVRHLLPTAATALVVDRDLVATLDALGAATGNRVVLAPGDPGYFGIVDAVTARHEEVAVVPAVSSVALAFAAAGVSWEDARVVSAHARPPGPAVNVCRRCPKVAVLTDPAFGPAELGRALAGLPKTFVVGERLGFPDERVTTVTPDRAGTGTWLEPNVVVVLEEAADRAPSPAVAAADPTSAVHDPVPLVVTGWLAPGVGDLVWDLAGDSAAVAIASAERGSAVVAVRSDRAAATVVSNASRRRGVPVDVVEGSLPGALSSLPDPDAVYVADAGAAFTEVVRVCADRAARCVVVAAENERRVGVVWRALDEAGLAVEATAVSAADLDAHGAPAGAPSVQLLVRGTRR